MSEDALSLQGDYKVPVKDNIFLSSIWHSSVRTGDSSEVLCIRLLTWLSSPLLALIRLLYHNFYLVSCVFATRPTLV